MEMCILGSGEVKDYINEVHFEGTEVALKKLKDAEFAEAFFKEVSALRYNRYINALIPQVKSFTPIVFNFWDFTLKMERNISSLNIYIKDLYFM